MTKEEAIAVLTGYIENPLVNDTKAFKMAIEALKKQTNTELIIKTTIREYLDKFYLDTNELLIDLNYDLCKRIRCKEVEK